MRFFLKGDLPAIVTTAVLQNNKNHCKNKISHVSDRQELARDA